MYKYNDCVKLFKSYISSYAAADTIEYYNINLRLFSEYLQNCKGSLEFDINELEKTDFLNYISYQRSRKIKNTSVRTYARAVKVFLRYLYNEGIMLNNITTNVKYPKSDKRLIVPLSTVRVNDLYNAMRKGYMWKRNHVIFSLMLDCGLRLQEVVNLDRDHINFESGYISVINSKNNKSRIVPMSKQVINNIRYYINDIHYFENRSAALILDNEYKKRITENSIELVFSKLKRYDPGIYPHLLRHTFATSFIMGGGSLEILRILMGHSDYNVTKEYLHIATQMKITGFDIYKLDDVFFQVYNYRSPSAR